MLAGFSLKNEERLTFRSSDVGFWEILTNTKSLEEQYKRNKTELPGRTRLLWTGR